MGKPSPTALIREALLGDPHRMPSAVRGGPGPRGRGRARLAAFVAALALGSCAGPDQERNLAPLVSRHSAAGGDAELEALGGLVLTRRDALSGERTYWAVRPLVSNRLEPDGDRFTWFLPPLGFAREDAAERTAVGQLLPIARYAETRRESGFLEWSLLVLPGVYWARKEDGRVQRVVVPFAGLVERFFSFDRAQFVLFPLWLRTERHGRTTDHVLFPFFSWSRGAGGTAWRAWPLAGNNAWDGRFYRRFFLWPFFHWQHNGQNLPQSEQQRSWMVWPLLGRSTRGEAHATTVLWPFFGYTSDPETGFWAWDGPWPLVVFQGGDRERASRQRVWPFYSRYEGDGLVQYWHPWPLVNRRHEVYEDGEKHAFAVYPFWRSHTRTSEGAAGTRGEADTRAGVERWRKLWPLFRYRSGPDGGHAAFPDPNPFQELDFLDEHYAWLWELYSRTTTVDTLRTRSWLGLWRRERDRDEDRRALSVLWAARDYSRAGRAVHERAWLFGLVRYRVTEGEGWRMLAPAIPGPGWPLQRVPSSLAPDAAGGAR